VERRAIRDEIAAFAGERDAPRRNAQVAVVVCVFVIAGGLYLIYIYIYIHIYIMVGFATVATAPLAGSGLFALSQQS